METAEQWRVLDKYYKVTFKTALFILYEFVKLKKNNVKLFPIKLLNPQ